MPLLVVGCTVVDVIFRNVSRLPMWPRHTEFTATNLVLLREAPLVTIGGNGANAAYVAGRCKTSVVLSSNVGRDWWGDQACRWLADAGCRVRTATVRSRTAVNVTAANARMQRATLFFPGAGPRVPLEAKGFTHALVCGWPHPTSAVLARALRQWRKSGVTSAYDVGPILGEPPTLASFSAALQYLDLFLANQHEFLAVTKAKTINEGLGRLRRAFQGDVVIKLGPQGAVWIPAGDMRQVKIAGIRIEARNTVGAGDTFNGALMAAREQGLDMPTALRAANRAAASVVRSARGVLGLQPPSLRQ
jgi:ribokinase